MKYSEAILAALRREVNAKNNKELSEILGIGYRNFNNWQTRGRIPTGRLYEIAQKLGVDLDILINGNINGGNNIIFRGDGNTIRGAEKIDDEILAEFCELYKQYRTPMVEGELITLIDRLKKIKKAQEE
ncbi:helix-turn-helix domain-containing protein [Campylobacter curvus]|uniref:Bacteriophage CI repressor N-terminal domain-containing protein n=1 Tax=Campylobacter curvus (strain 525.92) TaxID=360105 RepID=A0A0M4SFQ3_CAMC5|nr:helix-turn-helix domain-containing protein [Campylobacter curvus]ALF45116.1 putative protein, putative phage repressor [Campylobacter curvus 525.92]